MSLRGRPKGRDRLQLSIWTENEKQIVYALMDKSPGAAGLKYLEEKTGLSRRALLKHLKKLENDGVIAKENGVYRLTPAYSLEHKGDTVAFEPKITIPFIENGTLVSRVKSSSPFDIEIYGSNISPYREENTTSFESTIPVHNSEVIIKFNGTKPDTCQFMVFRYPIKP